MRRGPARRARIATMDALPRTPDDVSPAPRLLTIAELNRLARRTLEQSFPVLGVVGEISNLTRAASGHVYFTLKDDSAQVRCTMWRNKANLLPFRPDNGMQVEARATVTLYEARGDFQLGIEELRQAGAGSLFEAFMRLKRRLEAEGLFDPAHKRAPPRLPRRIGIVTSPAAAALRDVLATVARRAPHLQLVLYPALVQGDGAAAQIGAALQAASARAPHDQVDLILLVRGGGSIEDLAAFNDEALARAVRACAVPVISGVGHETDFTIADFAADVRAATPTGAAELATAGYVEATARLAQLDQALRRHMQQGLNTLAQRVDRAALQLRHPRTRLAAERERLTRLGQRLALARARVVERGWRRVELATVRLRALRPDTLTRRAQLDRLAHDLTHAGRKRVETSLSRLDALAAQLELLSPMAVLARGYSITRDSQGRIVREVRSIASGERVEVQLGDGRIDAQVLGTRRT